MTSEEFTRLLSAATAYTHQPEILVLSDGWEYQIEDIVEEITYANTEDPSLIRRRLLILCRNSPQIRKSEKKE